MKYREVTADPAFLQLGDLRLDLERQRVWRGGRAIELPGLSFRLLEVLARRAGQPVCRKELRSRVWGGIVVSDDALRQRVRLLRQALGDDNYIATVKGVGYRIAQPVVSASRPPRRLRAWLVAAAVCLALGSLALLASGVVPEAKHAIVHALRH